MPTFSDDDVLDFLVTEGVVCAGVEAEREAQRTQEAERAEEERHDPERRRAWAEEHGLIDAGGGRRV